jgi:hypothetical protein
MVIIIAIAGTDQRHKYGESPRYSKSDQIHDELIERVIQSGDHGASDA